MRKILFAILILLLSGLALGEGAGPERNEYCYERIAESLLLAIQHRDANAIRAVANNPPVFDGVAIGYLTGGVASEAELAKGKSPAADVLSGEKVSTRLTVVLSEGVREIYVVYLPARTARNFGELDEKVRRGEAKQFVDYVACMFVDTGDYVYMPHPCYAETDEQD